MGRVHQKLPKLDPPPGRFGRWMPWRWHQAQELGRRRRAGSSFKPSDVSGLRVWLDANNIPGVNEGDPLAVWPDLSGLGHNAVQDGGNGLPNWWPYGGSNGTSIVTFDPVGGPNRSLAIPHAADIAFTGSFSFFLVAKIFAGQPFRGGILSKVLLAGSAPSAFEYLFDINNKGYYGDALNGAYFNDPSYDFWGLLELHRDVGSATVQQFLNAYSQDGPLAINVSGIAGNTEPIVISRSVSAFLIIYVSEIVLFQGLVSGSDLSGLRSYFNEKYVLY